QAALQRQRLDARRRTGGPARRRRQAAVDVAAATGAAPARSAFTSAERRLIDRLRTPRAVQAFLNALPYNTEPPPDPATLRSFRGVVRRRTANCLEAALSAAVILEAHGYPPLVMS